MTLLRAVIRDVWSTLKLSLDTHRKLKRLDRVFP